MRGVSCARILAIRSELPDSEVVTVWTELRTGAACSTVRTELTIGAACWTVVTEPPPELNPEALPENPALLVVCELEHVH